MMARVEGLMAKPGCKIPNCKNRSMKGDPNVCSMHFKMLDEMTMEKVVMESRQLIEKTPWPVIWGVKALFEKDGLGGIAFEKETERRKEAGEVVQTKKGIFLKFKRVES
jgi:hypothetical protein